MRCAGPRGGGRGTARSPPPSRRAAHLKITPLRACHREGAAAASRGSHVLSALPCQPPTPASHPCRLQAAAAAAASGPVPLSPFPTLLFFYARTAVYGARFWQQSITASALVYLVRSKQTVQVYICHLDVLRRAELEYRVPGNFLKAKRVPRVRSVRQLCSINVVHVSRTLRLLGAQVAGAAETAASRPASHPAPAPAPAPAAAARALLRICCGTGTDPSCSRIEALPQPV